MLSLPRVWLVCKGQKLPWGRKAKEWVRVVDGLFTEILGDDFLKYKYDSSKETDVSDESYAKIQKYDHDIWEQSMSLDTAPNLHRKLEAQFAPLPFVPQVTPYALNSLEDMAGCPGDEKKGKKYCQICQNKQDPHCATCFPSQ